MNENKKVRPEKNREQVRKEYTPKITSKKPPRKIQN